MSTGLAIERVRTAGIFSLDGHDYEVENNVWLLGADTRVIVIDAAHDAAAIAEAVGDRKVAMIIATHGHNDHINAAVDLARLVGAPVALHPDDKMLWDAVHPGRTPDLALDDGQEIDFAGRHLRILHTPGHSPGGVCISIGGEGVVFTGDTLFDGGPGATGRSYSDYPTIVESIRTRLLPLPDETVVHTGHGDDTTIGAERAGSEQWRAPA